MWHCYILKMVTWNDFICKHWKLYLGHLLPDVLKLQIKNQQSFKNICFALKKKGFWVLSLIKSNNVYSSSDSTSSFSSVKLLQLLD